MDKSHLASLVGALAAGGIALAGSSDAAAHTIVYQESGHGYSTEIDVEGLTAGVYHVELWSSGYTGFWSAQGQAYLGTYHRAPVGSGGAFWTDPITPIVYTDGFGYGTSLTFEIFQDYQSEVYVTQDDYWQFAGVYKGTPIYYTKTLQSAQLHMQLYAYDLDPEPWDPQPFDYSFTMTRFDPVPEPSTWALMILGMGGAGGMLRRRRDLVAA